MFQDLLTIQGDIAGKGPGSVEAVDMTIKHCHDVIKGNWDYFIFKEEEDHPQLWHREKLGEKRIEYLRNLPMYMEFYMSGKLIRL